MDTSLMFSSLGIDHSINLISRSQLRDFVATLIKAYVTGVDVKLNDKHTYISTKANKSRTIHTRGSMIRLKLKMLSPEPKVDLPEDFDYSPMSRFIMDVDTDTFESNYSFSTPRILPPSNDMFDNFLKDTYPIDTIDVENGCVYYEILLFTNFLGFKDLLNNNIIKKRYTLNSNNLLLSFYTHCYLSQIEKRQIDSKIIFQYNTKTYAITSKYLLKTPNAVDILATHISVNLIQTDMATIPINQLKDNWKLIPLFKRQINSRHLQFVNFESFLKPNNLIFLEIDVYRKAIIFDKNHGLLYIPFYNTLMHVSDFHNIEYDPINHVLVFNLQFMKKLEIPVYEPDLSIIEAFINECNNWGKANQEAILPKFRIFENIGRCFNDVLYSSKMIMDKDKECLVVLYHNRIEINKIVKVHNFRTYLNSTFLLKYKFIFSANIDDICLDVNQYYSKDSLDFCMGFISYIQGNFINVYRNPKIINFTCKSISEKKIWFQYIDYLKVVI